MNRSSSILIAALLLTLGSCKRPAAEGSAGSAAKEEVLAMVGDESITTADFQREMSRRAPGSTVDREALLEEMIRHKVALVKARAEGFDKEPEITAMVEGLIASRFREARHAATFSAGPEVTEEEIVRFYESHSKRYRDPAAVRAGVIWIRAGARAAEEIRAGLRARAAMILEQARAAGDDEFVMLVRRHSEDQATRYSGGDTGWMGGDDLLSPGNPAIIGAAALLANPGDVAPLLESEDGFRIIRLTGRQPAGLRPLAAVRESIRYELEQARRHAAEDTFFEQLKEGVEIEINHPLLKSLPRPDIPALTKGPPPLPGG